MFDLIDHYIDLGRNVLAEDFDHASLLIAKVVFLGNGLGCVANVPVDQVRIPAFLDGMFHRVGLERIPEILWELSRNQDPIYGALALTPCRMRCHCPRKERPFENGGGM